eukprot:scaffold56511_cov22-Tisochrysis_lutea.AAC.2
MQGPSASPRAAYPPPPHLLAPVHPHAKAGAPDPPALRLQLQAIGELLQCLSHRPLTQPAGRCCWRGTGCSRGYARWRACWDTASGWPVCVRA